MSATISVIIPAYNAVPFLDETVASVLAQTRPAAEILIVDDASTDATAELAANYPAPVRLVRNTDNAGPGARRNQGASLATGNCFAFLDADDLWRPDHLEKVGVLLDQHADVGFAFSRVELFGSRGGVWPATIPCAGAPQDILLPLMRNNFIHLSAAVVRRDAFNAIGGFNSIIEFCNGRRVLADDYYFFLRLVLNNPAVGSPDPTTLYRWHEAQSSVYPNPQMIQSFTYRIRIRNVIAAKPGSAALLAAVDDRIRLSWEEYIELCWSRRDLDGLRQFVEFGMKEPLLAESTKPYRTRARFPAWGVALRDRLAKSGS